MNPPSCFNFMKWSIKAVLLTAAIEFLTILFN